MYEELLGENEVHSEEVFPKIFIGKTVEFDYARVDTLIENYDTYDMEYIRNYVLGLANKKEALLVESVN
jgi:FlaA1/EpsC-like NDP-sugar epimerase